jgi:two-component system sensor histidine kinase/response regulator
MVSTAYAPDERSERGHGRGQPERNVSTPSLLVVGDNAAVRRLIRQLFQQDYRLNFVKTKADALAAMRAGRFDLVLLDIGSYDAAAQGELGFDVLRALHGQSDCVTPPIIVISNPDDDAGVVQGLQLGAKDFITTPLDANVVRGRVRAQIALKRAESQTPSTKPAGTPEPTLSQLRFTQDMQEKFTRVVSHDLKGPLTNIRMAQFMLRDILRDNHEARPILDTMDLTLNSMVEMIRVFIDAMDSQQLEASLKPVDVHTLAAQTVEQYRLSAERKEIHITVRDCQAQVLADERLLRQVLSNLVSNAIKFSPKGTTTAIWTEQHDDKIHICVADGGPGIPVDERDKLFNMFSKLSIRPTGGENSTGLGLWIVKELTQLQNGRVGVDHPADGGALFWIELPSA